MYKCNLYLGCIRCLEENFRGRIRYTMSINNQYLILQSAKNKYTEMYLILYVLHLLRETISSCMCKSLNILLQIPQKNIKRNGNLLCWAHYLMSTREIQWNWYVLLYCNLLNLDQYSYIQSVECLDDLDYHEYG